MRNDEVVTRHPVHGSFRGFWLAGALALGGCSALSFYPLGMSEEEWNQLSPQQRLEARYTQAQIDAERRASWQAPEPSPAASYSAPESVAPAALAPVVTAVPAAPVVVVPSAPVVVPTTTIVTPAAPPPPVVVRPIVMPRGPLPAGRFGPDLPHRRPDANGRRQADDDDRDNAQRPGLFPHSRLNPPSPDDRPAPPAAAPSSARPTPPQREPGLRLSPVARPTASALTTSTPAPPPAVAAPSAPPAAASTPQALTASAPPAAEAKPEPAVATPAAEAQPKS